MRPSDPNYALANALASARWSNAETARRINEYALQLGHRGVAVDTARVGRWVRRGERPRSPVREIIIALLSRHLRTPHTEESLGLLDHLKLSPDADTLSALRSRAAQARLPVEAYALYVIRTAFNASDGMLNGNEVPDQAPYGGSVTNNQERPSQPSAPHRRQDHCTPSRPS